MRQTAIRPILIILLSLLLGLGLQAQEQEEGVVFQYSDLHEALQNNQDEQLILVDLFATWCGPCLVMDREVFPLKHVGDYINQNFIPVRIDADSEAGKTFMMEHRIEALPTLAILDSKGSMISSHSGLLDDYGLVRFAKGAKGELPDMNDLYKQHRKDKDNLETMQAILLEAPYFIQTVTSENQMRRWGLRISDIFQLYVEKKGIKEMANPTDFKLIALFHNFYEKDDQIIGGLIRHFADYAQSIDARVVAQFITGVHMPYIIGLAQSCDSTYEEELERLTSDMLHIYSAVQDDPEGFKSTLREYCLAACAISKKEVAPYVQHMENYFLMVPDITYNDYASAIEGVYNGLDEQLDPTSATAIIRWGSLALELEPEQVEASSPLCMVMGDGYRYLGEKEKAQQMYDYAFRLMMQSESAQFIQMMQPEISRRMEMLKQQ